MSSQVSPLGHELRRIAVATVLAVLLAGAVAFGLAARAAHTDANREVARVGANVTRGVVAPLVDDAVRRGDARAIDRLELAVRNRLSVGGLVHVEVYDDDGALLYSDKMPTVLERLEQGGTEVLEQQEEPVSLLPAGEGSLRESLYWVRVRASDAVGRPVTVETFFSTDGVRAEQRTNFVQGVLTSAAAASALLLVLVPSVLHVARRLRRGLDAQREAREHALQSSEIERARLAAHLHDEVIQDLAGVGYLLGATRLTMAHAPASTTARRLTEVQHHIEQSVGQLRQLLSDLYPTSLGQDLGTALEELCERSTLGGVTVEFSADGGQDATDATAAAVFRVAREALRNVTAHASACQAWVQLERVRGDVALTVRDNGRGFDVEDAGRHGHVGLRLMRDVARNAGGRLEVDSSTDGGTTVRLTVPG